MVDYVAYEKPEFLLVANGEGEAVLGEGAVTVHLEIGNTFM